MNTTINDIANGRKANMHNALDNAYCAVMFYYGEGDQVHCCATSVAGFEYDVLGLLAHAASMAHLMVNDNVNMEGGEQ